MEHMRQKTDECYIAAVAMVAGVPYKNLRRRKAGMAWRGTFSTRGETPRPFGTWKMPFAVLGIQHGLDPEPIMGYGDEYLWRTDKLDGRKLRGKGVLFVVWNDPTRGHAVAYEDGLIYDPDPEATGPVPAKEWAGIAKPDEWLKANYVGQGWRYEH